MEIIYVCRGCGWKGAELLSLEGTLFCPGCMEPVVLLTPAPAPRRGEGRLIKMKGKDVWQVRCLVVHPHTGKQCRGYAVQGDPDSRCRVHATTKLV